MRYYKIVISDPSSGKVLVPPGFEGLLGDATYTSFVNGVTLPNAWNVELDLPLIGSGTPQGFGLARVWGISRQEISQANDLGANASGSRPGKNIKIFGGMQKGLPLAQPSQSGLLFSGTIVQAYGNWIGTSMTLDLVVMPGTSSSGKPGGIGTLDQPKNIVLNWKAGSTLASALQTTLSTAFPYQIKIDIDSNIVRPNDEVGVFPTLEELGKYILETSKDVIKAKTYEGATLWLHNDVLQVADKKQASKKILFTDLIGQPTWIESPLIQMKTVMRSDLNIWDLLTLPETVITNTAAANSSIVNQRAAFQGDFRVSSARHVGTYRQASADSWVTVANLAPLVNVGT